MAVAFLEFTATSIADSSSRNAVSFSSARTTKRFPSPRCASTIQIVRPAASTAETQPQLQPTLGILDHLRCRFARFKLCVHLLEAHSKRFNLLLLTHRIRFQFLYFAVLFEELVEQHRVHRFVAHSVRFALLVTSYEIGIHLFHFLSHQA